MKLIDFGMSKVNSASVQSVSTAPREGILLFFSTSLFFYSSFSMLFETNTCLFSSWDGQVGSARDVRLSCSVDRQGRHLQSRHDLLGDSIAQSAIWRCKSTPLHHPNVCLTFPLCFLPPLFIHLASLMIIINFHDRCQPMRSSSILYKHLEGARRYPPTVLKYPSLTLASTFFSILFLFLLFSSSISLLSFLLFLLLLFLLLPKGVCSINQRMLVRWCSSPAIISSGARKVGRCNRSVCLLRPCASRRCVRLIILSSSLLLFLISFSLCFFSFLFLLFSSLLSFSCAYIMYAEMLATSDGTSDSSTTSGIPSTPTTPNATSITPSVVQDIDPASSQSRRFAVAGQYLISSSFPSWLLLFYSTSRFLSLILYTAEAVTTFAGHTSESIFKDGPKDGNGLNATFNCPSAMCINPHDGCMYVCDIYNNAIRRVSMKGIHKPALSFIYCLCVSFLLTTALAGDVTTTFVHQKSLVSQFMASGKRLNVPTGIIMSHQGDGFFVANSGNDTICKITLSGVETSCSFYNLIGCTHSLSRGCECVCWKWADGKPWWHWHKIRFQSPHMPCHRPRDRQSFCQWHW